MDNNLLDKSPNQLAPMTFAELKGKLKKKPLMDLSPSKTPNLTIKGNKIKNQSAITTVLDKL